MAAAMKRQYHQVDQGDQEAPVRDLPDAAPQSHSEALSMGDSALAHNLNSCTESQYDQSPSQSGARGKVPRQIKQQPRPEGPSPPCPRCASSSTKFAYYNNGSTTQPRYYCKDCQRYWTVGGVLRNVPPGSGRRKSRSAASRDRRKQHSGTTHAVSAPDSHACSSEATLPDHLMNSNPLASVLMNNLGISMPDSTATAKAGATMPHDAQSLDTSNQTADTMQRMQGMAPLLQAVTAASNPNVGLPYVSSLLPGAPGPGQLDSKASHLPISSLAINGQMSHSHGNVASAPQASFADTMGTSSALPMAQSSFTQAQDPSMMPRAAVSHQETQQDQKEVTLGTANGSEQQSAPAIDAQLRACDTAALCSVQPAPQAAAGAANQPDSTNYFYSLMQQQQPQQPAPPHGQQTLQTQAQQQQQVAAAAPFAAGGGTSAFAPVAPDAGAAAAAAPASNHMLASMASMPPAIQMLIAQNAAWLYSQVAQGNAPAAMHPTAGAMGLETGQGAAAPAGGAPTTTPPVAAAPAATGGVSEASPSTFKTAPFNLDPKRIPTVANTCSVEKHDASAAQMPMGSLGASCTVPPIAPLRNAPPAVTAEGPLGMGALPPMQFAPAGAAGVMPPSLLWAQPRPGFVPMIPPSMLPLAQSLPGQMPPASGMPGGGPLGMPVPVPGSAEAQPPMHSGASNA